MADTGKCRERGGLEHVRRPTIRSRAATQASAPTSPSTLIIRPMPVRSVLVSRTSADWIATAWSCGAPALSARPAARSRAGAGTRPARSVHAHCALHAFGGAGERLKIHMRRQIDAARRRQRADELVPADRLQRVADRAHDVTVVDDQRDAFGPHDPPAQFQRHLIGAPFEDFADPARGAFRSAEIRRTAEWDRARC